MANSVTHEMIKTYQASLLKSSRLKALQNAATNISVNEIALNRQVLTETDHTFSNMLDDWPVTDQKSSGRCWMFAGLNLLRSAAMKKMNLTDFEFSQNFVLFWDKIERANFFLESIIETAGKDLEDRKVAHLLAGPVVDGGQWNMFVDIIEKHGLVPKTFMPETESSSNTRLLNTILNTKLRQAAAHIRALCKDGASVDTVRIEKDKVLQAVYRILAIHLGDPPERFAWQWHDKEKGFHRDDEMTPAEFAKAYVMQSPTDYICLVNDPRSSHPYGKTFTVEFLGSVVGADPVLYLNVEIERMKELTIKTLSDGEPVWLGCDMGKMVHRKLGIMDAGLYEYELIYDTSLDMKKSERLEYHQSSMSHAMLFTGVDLVEGKPRRWRIENSWGDAVGKKGFFAMNDSWFDDFMYEIAVKKSYLSASELAALEVPPIVLPPWDPMGALAHD